MKSLKDFLEEDKSLTEKMNYEEFKNSIVNGINDSGLEEAYDEYLKVKDNCKMKVEE